LAEAINNIMHPELKQQLYGGEISDYYPNNQSVKTSEEDNKALSDIYKEIITKKRLDIHNLINTVVS
jgi:hypothetical protein